MGGVMDRFRLEGRVALVTGGTRGLGRVIAEALAEAGADVGVSARDGDAAARTADEIARSAGRKTLGLAVDVAVSSQVDAMVERVLGSLGRIDILVNNAGINIRGPIEQLAEADW